LRERWTSGDAYFAAFVDRDLENEKFWLDKVFSAQAVWRGTFGDKNH
jgi:hypothetical protein